VERLPEIITDVDGRAHIHARRHAGTAHHPVFALADPGGRWLYCFSDDSFVEY
jgi:hypothetical protein